MDAPKNGRNWEMDDFVQYGLTLPFLIYPIILGAFYGLFEFSININKILIPLESYCGDSVDMILLRGPPRTMDMFQCTYIWWSFWSLLIPSAYWCGTKGIFSMIPSAYRHLPFYTFNNLWFKNYKLLYNSNIW